MDSGLEEALAGQRSKVQLSIAIDMSEATGDALRRRVPVKSTL